MSNMGHNETAVRLAGLAGDAQIALDKVARGEADALEGWLAYGAALNEGRALFPGDAEFGKWVAENSLSQLGTAEVSRDERTAAMWAASNADQLADAKAASKARTLRGWHDQWKKLVADREAEAREAEEEAKRKADAEAARKAAKITAKAEQEAKAEVEAAKTDDERQAAQIKVAKASEEKAKAEAAVAKAENPEEESAEEIDAEVSAVMRKHGGLTREALLRDFAELTVANKKERADDKAEIKRLKDRLRDLEDDDKNTVIRRMQRSVSHAESEKWRAIEEQRRLQGQVYALKKRVTELENMGVVTL